MVRVRVLREPRGQQEALYGATDSQHVVVLATVGEQLRQVAERISNVSLHGSGTLP